MRFLHSVQNSDTTADKIKKGEDVGDLFHQKKTTDDGQLTTIGQGALFCLYFICLKNF